MIICHSVCYPDRVNLSFAALQMNRDVGFSSTAVGPFLMGWLRDLSGTFDSGLLMIAGVCNIAAVAILCIHHDKEAELPPILDEPRADPGRVAEIV